MPTIPSEPVRPSEAEPHRQRQVAESFGTDPERYDRTRPRYPDEMVAAIVAAIPGADVVDVGCGTGIVARQFQAAGCRVLGVDVDARMADFARKGGLEVEVATFEKWDHAGRTFDAVVGGQTWHWIDPVAGAAKAADVLRPGGRLAVFWNADLTPDDLREAFSEVYLRAAPDSPVPRRMAAGEDPYGMLCTRAADGIRQVDAFGEPERWRFEWERSYTRDEWLDLVPTQGGFSLFSPETQAQILSGVGAAIDAVGGAFAMRYATVVVTAVRGQGKPEPR